MCCNYVYEFRNVKKYRPSCAPHKCKDIEMSSNDKDEVRQLPILYLLKFENQMVVWSKKPRWIVNCIENDKLLVAAFRKAALRPMSEIGMKPCHLSSPMFHSSSMLVGKLGVTC